MTNMFKEYNRQMLILEYLSYIDLKKVDKKMVNDFIKKVNDGKKLNETERVISNNLFKNKKEELINFIIKNFTQHTIINDFTFKVLYDLLDVIFNKDKINISQYLRDVKIEN